MWEEIDSELLSSEEGYRLCRRKTYRAIVNGQIVLRVTYETSTNCYWDVRHETMVSLGPLVLTEKERVARLFGAKSD